MRISNGHCHLESEFSFILGIWVFLVYIVLWCSFAKENFLMLICLDFQWLGGKVLLRCVMKTDSGSISSFFSYISFLFFFFSPHFVIKTRHIPFVHKYIVVLAFYDTDRV